MCHLLHYVCFTGKSENLAETPILKDIFIFLANGHSFQKCSFLVEILSFLKEVFSVFEKCQILMALFLFGKKYHFMQKVLVFGQRSEFLSTVIKSSRAKLWGKVTSVFLNINFCAKLSIFWEKNWNFVRNFDFFKQLCSTSECEYLIGKRLFSENCDFLCECLYTLRNCQNLIKTSIFLRKCLFVHVLIFIRVFLLLENCYFDSKYDFIRWYFGKKCHFPSKIYISGGINFLEKSSNFLRKGVNLAVNFGKNDNWY